MSAVMMGAAALLAPSVLAVGLGLGPERPAGGDAADDLAPSVLAGEPGDAAQGWGPRLEEVCRRVPVRIEGVKAAQDRLAAGARTPGSIAFLQARIDRAEAAGQADTARLLGNRLAVRRDIGALLPDVLLRLQDSQEVCDAHQPDAPGQSSWGGA